MCAETRIGFGDTKYSAGTVLENGWDQNTFHFVNCPSCGLNNKGVVGHKSREDAAAAWNRRAAPPSPPAAQSSAVVAMVIPYTDEDDKPDMDDWRMIAIGRPGDIPDHVLDRIPAKAAGIICDAINAVAPGAQPDSLTSILEFRPDLGAATPEPSLREIVHGYYAANFRDGGSAKFADEYLAALSPAPVVDCRINGGRHSALDVLRDMTALFEMTDEAQQPGTDSYTVLKQAQEVLSTGEAANG